ncbi:putative indole-3-pyruvate monooxygenase YUCCA10 [Bidens hawaiensis]|uniref:putative indole-3-pyruvate monooxygenase YUCCA10 n=1 Tax=Bidens hawaiensis TaxID=980011 RepID=UPI00404A7751
MTNSAAEQTTVLIVGAGPSGLATAACLHQLSIPYIMLEREDCIASIFNKYSYNRLHLHLQKQYCELPHLPFPKEFPTYVPRKDFLNYLNNYASCFNINPRFNNLVKFAKFEEGKWKVEVEVGGDGNNNNIWYEGRFLVVATGENTEPVVPEVEGLSEFKGEVIHSTEYKSGEKYENKNVLVVGAGNSGMETALDLANYGAKTSIVIRSPVHVVSRWSVNLGLMLQKSLPLHLVDSMLVLVNIIMYGDLTKYGIQRPKEGPFSGLVRIGKYPIIDMGTTEKIKSGEIQVLPALKSIKGGGDEVVFENGKSYQFDVILFATGFKRSTHLWLKGDHGLNQDGLPKAMFPNHWKGDNGLYFVGLARHGLYGAAMDSQNIAQHIFKLI